MNRNKLPVVRAGGDWAAVLGHRLGHHSTDLAHHAAEQTRQRLRLALVAFVAVFCVLTARLTYLTMIGEGPSFSISASATDAQTRPIITDRHGVVLATQITTTTLGANPREITDATRVVGQLKDILPNLAEARATRLLSGNSAYVKLASRLTPDQRMAILNLGNPALKLRNQPSRVYPTSKVASHIVGFTSSDMRGLLGLELLIDQLDDEAPYAPRNEVFETSLDIRVQHAVRDELYAAMVKHKASKAAAMVMDAHNGEIIASVSLPDFDANRPMADGNEGHFNMVTQGVYELGSIFKIFTAAMAIDGGYVEADELFDVDEVLKIGGNEISDDHPQEGPLSVDGIVTYSSNIGSAKLALRVPDEEHFAFMQKLGLTDPVDFSFPARQTPIAPSRWTDIERATASYGHGIAVTPLHALVAGAAMMNGGVLYPPSLQKVSMPVGQRVISGETSARLRRMLRNVVELGTGKSAEVKGYGVLGKTGSADKPNNGSYDENALTTSFIGGFPVASPRYVTFVMFDEPAAIEGSFGYATAGWNAAPTTRDIVKRIAPILGVLPKNEQVKEAFINRSPAKLLAAETQGGSYAP